MDRRLCLDDVDCEGGAYCTDQGLGDFRDWCTTRCETDEDCEDGDGFAYVCAPRPTDDVRVCVRVCDAPNQCGDQGICYQSDNYVGADAACVGVPADACDGDAACAADEACIYFGGSVEWAPVCGPRASVGGLRGGEVCDPSDPNPPLAQECAIGLCDPHGVCSSPCASDDDCADASFSCQGFTVGTQEGTDLLGYCLVGPNQGPPCERDGDCEAGQVCSLASALTGERVLVCKDLIDGEAVAGERCEDDAATPDVEPVRACASSLCIDSCRALCVIDADCESGTCEVLALAGGDLGVCTLP